MIRNIHPADELALIRDDIRRLQARETFLRRKFLRNRLPQSILDDSAYWEDQRSQQIRLRPR